MVNTFRRLAAKWAHLLRADEGSSGSTMDLFHVALSHTRNQHVAKMVPPYRAGLRSLKATCLPRQRRKKAEKDEVVHIATTGRVFPVFSFQTVVSKYVYFARKLDTLQASICARQLCVRERCFQRRRFIKIGSIRSAKAIHSLAWRPLSWQLANDENRIVHLIVSSCAIDN